MSQFTFRAAERDEVPAVFDLIMARVRWMDKVGIRQWNVTDYAGCYPPAHYEAARERGDLFVLTDEEGIAACAVLLQEDERWPEALQAEPAFYLHHLASRIGAKGAGRRFLQMAEEYALTQGKTRFRLDSADDNTFLAEYYTAQGYVPVGTCVDGLYTGILREKVLQGGSISSGWEGAPILQTDRLTIRPIEAEDWETIRLIWTAEKESPYAQYIMPHETDPETARHTIAHWAACTRGGTEHTYLAVCLDEKVIGYCAIHARDDGHEIGYHFHPAQQGKGYAREALTALLTHLWSQGIRRIYASTALKNAPSVKLLTSLGFRLSGTKVISLDLDMLVEDGIFERMHPCEAPMLTTDRLTIRPIEAEDWPAVREIWAALAPLPMAQYDKPHDITPDNVRARVARWADFTLRGTEHLFFAVCRTDAVIGYIAFNQRETGHEIGYSFHPAYHGQGYAKEALSALLAHLRGMGLTRFSAGTALNNTPSVRLLEGLGFRLTGTEQVSFYKDADGQDIVFEGGIFELVLT